MKLWIGSSAFSKWHSRGKEICSIVSIVDDRKRAMNYRKIEILRREDLENGLWFDP